MILSLETLPEMIRTLLSDVKEKKLNLILLEGNLGRGKTTCVQEIARALGVEATVQSPTFVLMKSYDTKDGHFTKLAHIDAYRITDGSLFRLLDLERLLQNPQTLVCVEWPEFIAPLEQFPHALVHLEYDGSETGVGERTIDISFTS